MSKIMTLIVKRVDDNVAALPFQAPDWMTVTEFHENIEEAVKAWLLSADGAMVRKSLDDGFCLEDLVQNEIPMYYWRYANLVPLFSENDFAVALDCDHTIIEDEDIQKELEDKVAEYVASGESPFGDAEIDCNTLWDIVDEATGTDPESLRIACEDVLHPERKDEKLCQ